jgi:hypothetical protein
MRLHFFLGGFLQPSGTNPGGSSRRWGSVLGLLACACQASQAEIPLRDCSPRSQQAVFQIGRGANSTGGSVRIGKPQSSAMSKP